MPIAGVFAILLLTAFAARAARTHRSSIDDAVGECSAVRAIAERRGEGRTEMTEPTARPNAGGHPAEARCPPGFVVTGFRSMSGEYMDHLWLVCSELKRDY